MHRSEAPTHNLLAKKASVWPLSWIARKLEPRRSRVYPDGYIYIYYFSTYHLWLTSHLRSILDVPKKYTSLKSYIFVLRTDKSLNFVSFVRQDLNLNFDT